MPSTVTRSSALLLGVLAVWAHAHPKGFHKRVTATVTPSKVTVLVVMDVDSGEQCLLLREAADVDRDGLLAGDEVGALKRRLVKLATGALKVKWSDAPLRLETIDVKLSLREDRRANDGPLSVVVLLEREQPGAFITPDLLELTDLAPDQSPVEWVIYGQAGDGGQIRVRSSAH